MTIDQTQTDELNAMSTHRERVRYAIANVNKAPEDITTADLQAWLFDRGHVLGEKSQRSTVSKYLNEWRNLPENQHRSFPSKTGEQPRLTDEMLAEFDAVRAEDFGPRDDSPVSPALSRPASAPSLPPVASTPPRAVTPPRDVPAPRHADRDTVTPTASRHTDDTTTDRDAGEPSKPSRWSRAKARASASFIWIQYAGLLQVAAYGLFQVLYEVAGTPLPTAIGGALAVELVGISLKMFADMAERDGEKYQVVRRLLIASGVVAFGIGGANAWGHAHIPVPGGNPYVAAALFGIASIAGYSLWTIRTWLAHRAKLRGKGQLEGPGLRVPAYIRDRYGSDVADRAEKLSRFNAELSTDQAVEQARAELDAEAREKRETERREALREGLIAHANETHDDELAAAMESARFSADLLADRFTASTDEHDAKVRELLDWMTTHKK